MLFFQEKQLQCEVTSHNYQLYRSMSLWLLIQFEQIINAAMSSSNSYWSKPKSKQTTITSGETQWSKLEERRYNLCFMHKCNVINRNALDRVHKFWAGVV